MSLNEEKCRECRIFKNKRELLLKVVDEAIESLSAIVHKGIQGDLITEEGILAYESMGKIQAILQEINDEQMDS